MEKSMNNKYVKRYSQLNPKLSKKPAMLLIGLVMLTGISVKPVVSKTIVPTVEPYTIEKNVIAVPTPIVAEAPKQPQKIVGLASWYDYTLKDGWSSVGHYVCASKDFPRGSVLRVKSLVNSRVVNCTVTDYGPAIKGRVIDLSSETFKNLQPLKLGVIRVQVELAK